MQKMLNHATSKYEGNTTTAGSALFWLVSWLCIQNFKKGEREEGQNRQVWRHDRGRLDQPNLNMIADLKAASSDLI
jgi:hypothetical protein